MTLLRTMKRLVLIAGLSVGFIAITPVCGALRWQNGETQAEEAGTSSNVQRCGTADSARQSLEERIASLEREIGKLHADMRQIAARANAGDDELTKMYSNIAASVYPNAAPLYAEDDTSPYSVKSPPKKRLPPPQSLKRRRERVPSTSSLPRPGGEIQQKPAKNAKADAEMIDVYFRTSGGAEAMTEVVHALERLDEDIRFSQNSDQLLVRTTRAGQEVVRQLIHYYERRIER